MFKDLSLFLHSLTIWCDNMSTIALASNPVFHARTKHVEVDYHYVREKVVRKELQVQFVSTTDQVADIFTKGLSSTRFHFLVNKLPVLPRPVSLRGSDKPRVTNSEESVSNSQLKSITGEDISESVYSNRIR